MQCDYQAEIDSKVILFIVSVSKRDGQNWVIEKRYSEFDELYSTLIKMFANIPSMPGKTLFKLREHTEIEKRRIALDYLLKQIVTRADVFNSEALKQFLQLVKHASEQIMNPPKLLGEITGFIHGVRDYLYDKGQNVIYALTSDMNVASRVDAYLTNMKMPWEKEAPSTLLAVGCLLCWVKVNDDSELKYERMWNKTYPIRLNMSLFGYDLILEHNTNKLYIIDINYFPGYKNVDNVVNLFNNLFRK